MCGHHLSSMNPQLPAFFKFSVRAANFRDALKVEILEIYLFVLCCSVCFAYVLMCYVLFCFVLLGSPFPEKVLRKTFVEIL